MDTQLHDLNSLLDKGTVEVIVKEDLKRKLFSSKKLRVKLGIDPSGSDLHLGHMVVVRKLKEFQELGHHIVLIFGNFTGQIGDPTGKMEARKIHTQKELEDNARKYLDQVKVLLDVARIEVRWNAEWLAPLNFSDVVALASNFTVMQMLERDMFQVRVKKQLPISLHEFLYPLMQGYDSVAIKSDVELGGTDQTFNLLAGRTLQKAYGQMPQDIMTMPILEGMDGHIKMGKSENNYIGVSDEPSQMYGKVMSIPDNLILKYFELTTDVSLKDLNEIKADLGRGVNPRDLKMRLAREIVTIYHSINDAKKSEEEFSKVFQKKGIPDDIMEITVSKRSWPIIDLLMMTKLVSSKNEARRLVSQNAVTLANRIIADIETVTDISSGDILQIGKRRFVRFNIE